MATTNYTINYDDEQFKQVETEKETALNDINSKYNNMINQSDQFYQDQMNAVDDYTKTQQEIQQQQTDFAIEQVNQQKAQAEKDYTKEQKASYVDWQKQSNQYGANAEQMAANGLTNTGYSESSQVSMYNQYQGRVATARESFNRANLEFENAKKEYTLANNSKLAEIAQNALMKKLELSLQGFQYKNSLISEQIQQQQATEDRYYARWQDVLNQMNQENQFAESIRQYEQNYNLQLQQFEEEKKQYEQNYAQQVKEYEESIRQFDEQMEYYRQKDAEENAYKIKQLELQKQQLQQEQKQWEKEYKLKQQQLAEEQRQFNQSYKATYSSGGYTNGGNGNTTYTDDTTSSNSKNTSATTNTFGNSKSTIAKKDYYFSNGYQPRYVNNQKIAGIGVTVGEVFGNKFGEKLKGQKIWKSANNRYYVWVGNGKKSGEYVDVTSYAKQINSKIGFWDGVANIFR